MMRCKRTGLLLSLVLIFGWTSPFEAQSVGLLPVPTLDGVEVQIQALFDIGTGFYSYSYTVTNPAGNTGRIRSIRVDIARQPNNTRFIDSTGLTITIGAQSLSFDELRAIFAPINPRPVVPVGTQVPGGWDSGLGANGFAAFSSGDPLTVGSDMIVPGQTKSGFALISPGVPTIRQIEFIPHWVFLVESEDTVTPEEARQARAVKESLRFRTMTLGPSAVQPGAYEHWDQLRNDLNQAIQLGWIPDATLATTLVNQLAEARQALDAIDGTLAKTRLQTLLQTVTQSAPAQRRPEVHDLIVLNTQRLIEGTPDTPIPFEPKVTVAPLEPTLPIGAQYTLTATVVNLGDPTNPPIADFPLAFQVVDGPHVGTEFSGVTDAQGKLSFSYTGSQLGGDKVSVLQVGEVLEEVGSAQVTWAGGPDLVIQLFIPPVIQGMAGQSIPVTEITDNTGNAPAGPSVTRYFLSANPVPDPTVDQPLGERVVPSLNAGQSSQSGSVTLRLPDNLPAGTYRLGACADADGTVAELNEQNNCRPTQVVVALKLQASSDTIPPTTTATASPGPNAAGWNNTDVTVTLTATDNPDGSGVQTITYTLAGAQTGSGLAAGSSTSFTISAEGATTVTYHATDNAGNVEADKTLVIKIDKTPPTLVFGATTPAPNAAGWNNTMPVTIAYAAADNLSGVAATSSVSPLRFTVETSGATQTVAVTDVAGNSASFISPVVKIDTTSPEAFNQFDPVSKDVVVFGRDALSGVPSGPLSVLSVVLTRWGDGEGDDDKDSKAEEKRKAKETEETKREGRDEDKENAELRTYKVMDVAGNSLLLVEKVKREGHEIKVRIVSLQYQSGPVLTPPRNKKEFEWAGEQDGFIKELEQRMTVRKGQAKQEVEAKFEREKNQTTIKAEEPKPETKVVKPGLVLLRMVTDKGQLDIEF